MSENFPGRQGGREFQDDRITHTEAQEIWEKETLYFRQEPEEKEAWCGVTWLEMREKKGPGEQLVEGLERHTKETSWQW